MNRSGKDLKEKNWSGIDRSIVWLLYGEGPDDNDMILLDVDVFVVVWSSHMDYASDSALFLRVLSPPYKAVKKVKG